jgi:D-glycero-D-manno-heptose 1,7-bisphosphate phosphatase
VVRVDDPTVCLRLVAGRPVLWWLLRELSRFGISEILLLASAGLTDVSAALPRRLRVTRLAVPAGSGSGGALFHIRDQLRDRFLLYDGGRPFDWNLARLLADGAGDEPSIVGRLAQPDTGMALFRRALIDQLRPVCSLEADVLPGLAERGLLRVTMMNGGPVTAEVFPFVSGPVVSGPVVLGPVVSGPGLAPQGHDTGIARLRRKALFLDRDGVLNVDHGFVGCRDRFEWTDGALDAIRYATEAGWHVFVVTNQSGVARGFYTEDAVRHLLDWMAGEALAAGGTIDDVRFCPFHPQAEVAAYRQAHPWRKPLPGMLLDLIDAWELDPKRAVMVGDQATDMQAAAAAGVAGHLFRGGNLLDFLRPILQGCADT